MVHLLRWGTFIVLILVLIGAAANYPLLRARFYALMPASPVTTITTARSTPPVEVIAAPTVPPVPTKTHPGALPDHTIEVAAATTSLPNAITPIVLGPSTPEVTTLEMSPDAVVPMVATGAGVSSPTIISTAPPSTPKVLSNGVAIPPAPILSPRGPRAKVASKLYVSPDLTTPSVKQVRRGERLTVVGLYTEGNWLLLGNGLWIPGDAVDNAPLALPLVFPTMTPPP